MKPELKQEMDHMEVQIGQIMRVGVFIAVALMVVGILLVLVKPNTNMNAYTQFTHLDAMFAGMVQLHPLAWLMAGLLMLILTPVLRVVASIFAFAKVHDMIYVWITVAVFAILVVAILYGHSGV
ncbi:MAG: DUF1634 domain-containing protein [Lactobacillaceae bacterium]|jgi:uncharacterized membrane protein|nr:DUF1634 domain-containing protein [Lactobacillaceae bacterium]